MFYDIPGPLSPQNTLYTCIEMASAIISLPIAPCSPKIILITTNRIDAVDDDGDKDDPHQTPPTTPL